MFKIDGPIWRFFSALGDMIVLHLLWLLCCIPIVTIGPATTAAHYVTMKLVKDEGSTVIEMFLKSFRKNFKQGTVLGVIFTAVGIILAADFYLCIYVLKESNLFKFVMLSALGFLTILYLIEMIYLWAVLATFDNTSKQTALNALLLALSNIRDTSVMLAADLIIGVVAVLSAAFIPQLAILFAIFGLPLIFTVNSFKLRKILDGVKYSRTGDGGKKDA